MTATERDDRNSDDHAAKVISKAVFALSLTAFASGISQRVTDPLLPRMASEFGMALGRVSWVITCFTIGYALCQLFFGPIGDRYGKYWVVAWACIASSVATLLCALAPGLSLLLVARTLAGGATAGLIPLTMAWIGDVVPYEGRQSVLARTLIGYTLGVSAGQLLGGLSADYFGRRVPFFIVAVLFLASALRLFAIRRRLPASALATQSSDAHGLQHLWREFSLVFAQRWVRVVVRTVLIEGALVYGAFAFFAAHLHRVLNVSMTASGAMVMGFGFGGFSFATVSRRLVVRMGEIGLAYAGAVVMLAALCVIAFAPNAWLAAAACFAMGIGFYMLHTTLQTNATQMAPQRRGAAVSAFAFCYFVGQSLGVAVDGWLVGRIGSSGMILIAALGVPLVALNFAREKRLQLQS